MGEVNAYIYFNPRYALPPLTKEWQRRQLKKGQDKQQYMPVWELATLPAGLKAAGEALCAALPTALSCNNPACTNLDTISEAFMLVRGKASLCGGCLHDAPQQSGPQAGTLLEIALQWCLSAAQIPGHAACHAVGCPLLAPIKPS